MHSASARCQLYVTGVSTMIWLPFLLALSIAVAAPRSASCQKPGTVDDVGGSVTVLLDSSVTISKRHLWYPFAHLVKTSATFNALCVAIPNGYTENFDRMEMDGPSGRSVSIDAVVRLADSTEIPMEFASFQRWRSATGESGRGYCLNLSRGHYRLPIGTRLVGLLLWSSEAITINQITWLSFN